MKRRRNVLMIAPLQSSFIMKDIEMLAKQFTVIRIVGEWQSKLFIPLSLVLQIFSMFRHIWRAKSIVIQFGGYWALIPSVFGRLFKVPVFIILHGTDCASLPSLNYGSLRKWLIKMSCRIAYSNASLLLPVSASLMYSENNYNSKNILQGVRHHLPSVKTAYRVIHNGLDSEFWVVDGEVIRENNRFIAVFSASQFILKGGDLIIAAANKYEQCKFYIAGTERSSEFGEIPDNVYFLGKLSREELREQYRRAQFHFQLSMFEGFGLALCEAMLCECVPIGSSVNMIPEIIGDTGFILKKRDPVALVQVIEVAKSNNDLGLLSREARNRISDRFSLGRRAEMLIDTINSYN